MTLANRLRRRKLLRWLPVLGAIGVLAWLEPHALVEGVQRGGLYAVLVLPMALVLGILGLINLAHGEFMMLGGYLAYGLFVHANVDPLLTLLPALAVFAVLGAVTYLGTIGRVLKAPRLIQLLLTFGVSLLIGEMATMLWTSRPVKPSLPYVWSSLRVGTLTFGTFAFVYTGAAFAVLIGLILFLRRTRTGMAALAAGQNPRGAQLVGINVNRIYLLVFSLSVALTGAIGVLFATRHSVFPYVGSPYTLKGVPLIALAGIGNLPGLVFAGIGLGVVEAVVMSFPETYRWADIVFFVLLIGVVIARSYRRQSQ